MRLEELEDVKQLQHIAERLWSLLDDIDTISDMAKGDDQWYRKRVECVQSKRFDYVTSDGYDLFINEEK